MEIYEGNDGRMFQECVALEEKLSVIIDEMIAAGECDATIKIDADKRKALPDNAFCGPNRSFPIFEGAHVTAARQLISSVKMSADTKARILASVNRKAKTLGCNKKEDIATNNILDISEKHGDIMGEHALIHKWYNDTKSRLILDGDALIIMHTRIVSELLDFTLPELHEVKDDLDKTLPTQYRNGG